MIRDVMVENKSQTFDPDTQLLLKRQMESNFYAFCKGILNLTFMEKPLHKVVCDFLSDYSISKKKLLILPRGFLKTSIASVGMPIWAAIQNPDIRILTVMNTQLNASKRLAEIRGNFEKTPLLYGLWSDCIPNFNKVRWNDSCAVLNRSHEYPEGTFESAGIGTNVVSRHYDMIIEDDTVAPGKDDITGEELAPTQEEIEKAIAMHKLMISLFVNPSNAIHIVASTRWSYYDLPKYIMDNEKDFQVLDIPAVANSVTSKLLGIPDGQPVHPSRFTLDVLRSIELSLGTYFYSALYANTPMRTEDMVFKPEWFKYWDKLGEMPYKDIVSIDPAISVRNKSSYAVILRCRHYPDGSLDVMDYIRKPGMSNEDFVKEVFKMDDEGHLHEVKIEAEGYQESLIYTFRDKMRSSGRLLNVIPCKTKGVAKDARIRALQPKMQHGYIRLGRGMAELETELKNFPFSRTKDIADALAWQLPDSIMPLFEKTVTSDKWDWHQKYQVRTDDILDELQGRNRKGLFAGVANSNFNN